jgi:hypothetical protein
LFSLNFGTAAFGQTSNTTDSTKFSKLQKQKPEIFTSGFIDILNSGQVNASARFIRLFIGEPGKFAIPLSFYSGVSSNNLQGGASSSTTGSRNNEQLVTSYINPLSGLINLSSDGILFLNKQKRLRKQALCIT